MASLGHDVGHPGVNNGFMVTTATPLAVIYNDKSVLESYHSMAFFKLVCKYFAHANIDIEACSDYKGLSSDSFYKDFRRIVVHSILCTDMGCHQDYLASIIQTTREINEHARTLSQEEERLVLCSAIMKCADISNCTRPFDNAKRWAMILAEEFSMQGDLERELGIPSLPINERGKVSLPDFQLYFMENVAMDLYVSFGQLFPEMKYCAENIKKNIEIWQAKKKEACHP
ncbi:hypothetical protein INT47_009191 [Mucor saturninus]|uniref:PDEase domain-containing protein n=1 Tax=Mucor saturninus TaxID=64648 RepID=A0A8H7VCA1_9FUNG|nr:hypothetical protein INT47_009191 [Mucor saturninus]